MSPARAVPAAVAIGFLLLSTSGDATAIEAPVLSIGDRWTYATNTSGAQALFFTGPVTFAVDARVPLEVNGTRHEVFRVTVSGSGEAEGIVDLNGTRFHVDGTWTLVGEEFLSTTALKILSSYLQVIAEGRTEPLNLALTIRLENTTTVEILEDSWRFPVEEGDAGHVTARFHSTEQFLARAGIYAESSSSNGTGVRTIAFEAGPIARTEVTAGAFDAIRIEERWPDGRRTSSYFATSVGNNVRTESFDETGARVASSELVSFRYQAGEPGSFLDAGIVIPAAVAAGAIAVPAVAWALRRRRARGVRPRG